MGAMRDRRTGDVWFTVLMGQVFHVSGNKMQYCFGEVILFEQSPFSMHAVDENSVTFCWRTGLRGMPTQARGCSGCDCAKMIINLVDHDTLQFKFWMSGEVLHLDMTLGRKDPEPSFMSAVWPLMPYPYQQCAFRDHYGPNIPGEPDLKPHMGMKMPGGCARTVMKMARTNPDFAALLDEASASVDNADVGAGTGRCHQLNGFNFLWNTFAKRAMPWHAMEVADVRLEYKE